MKFILTLNNVIAHIESLILIDISLVCTIPLHLNTYTYTPGFSVIYGWALTSATVYNTIRRCKFMVNNWTTLLSYSSEDVSSWWINEPLSYSSESLVLYGWALTPATVQHKNKQVLGEYITNFLAYLFDSSWEPRLQPLPMVPFHWILGTYTRNETGVAERCRSPTQVYQCHLTEMGLAT